MPATTHNLDIFILIDTDGNYAIGRNHDEMMEQWKDSIDDTLVGSRMLRAKLTVEMPPPVELTISVPAKEGEVNIKVEG